MATRLHPGVYVEEVPGGARAIEAIGTSTAIFVGESERGPLEPMKLRSFDDYQRLYGGYLRPNSSGGEPCLLAHAVDAFFQNGGTAAYVLRALEMDSTSTPVATGSRDVVVADGSTKKVLAASSPGVWCKANGVLTVFAPSSDGDAGHFRIFIFLQPTGSSELRLVETWDRLSTSAGEGFVVDVLQRSLYIRWCSDTAPFRPDPDITKEVAASSEQNLISIVRTMFTAAETPSTFKTQFTDGKGGDLDVDPTRFAAVLRQLDSVTDASLLILPGKVEASHISNAISYIETRPLRDLFYIADLPREEGKDSATSAVESVMGVLDGMARSDLAAAYWPWLLVSDPSGRSAALAVPPSGHVAGLYARTDARRGVWKAPAGVEATLLGIQSLDYKLLDGNQDDMNPKGLNALRLMPSAGAVVWGARTLRPDSEWRYVSVRRLAIFLRKSLYEGIQWAVFEPNDEPLWASLRSAVGAFMEQLFRQGAFAGRTSRDAYFVKCDAETTRPEDQASGVVNVWVGFAPLRPAEFVVLKLSQKVDQKA